MYIYLFKCVGYSIVTIVEVYIQNIMPLCTCKINGVQIRTRLKTEDWQAQIQEELKICIVNTTPLYNQFSNSLLGEDFSTPALEFESGLIILYRYFKFLVVDHSQLKELKTTNGKIGPVTDHIYEILNCTIFVI